MIILCYIPYNCQVWTWARETAGHYARNCVTMTGFGHAGTDPNMVSGSRECEVGMEYEV